MEAYIVCRHFLYKKGKNMDSEEELIKLYFHLGFKYEEIVLYLLNIHNIKMSLKTLKRRLKAMSLYRRKNKTSVEDVVDYISNLMKETGQLQGYRWIHLRSITDGKRIPREMIRISLGIIDPEGVEARRKRRLQRRKYSNPGPNYLWHLDGYDKLKPYGLAIHGCIDGFSRYILWLQVGQTNNDPSVTSQFFLSAVEELKGIPKTVRFDCGTENGTIEIIQRILRQMYGESNRPEIIYGTSPANQRIESYWSFLRKNRSQFFMNLFEELSNDGKFESNFVDKNLIRFCFTHIVQKELDAVTIEWNAHNIRKCKNSNSPSGRPMTMFLLPEELEADDHLITVKQEDVNLLKPLCRTADICDPLIKEFCSTIMFEHSIEKPDSVEDAVNLYNFLRVVIYEELKNN